MSTIEPLRLDPVTRDRLQLLAAAWQVTEADAVRELMDRLAMTVISPGEPGATEAAVTAAGGGESGLPEGNSTMDRRIPIHAVYQGVRTDAYFDPTTHSVMIWRGPHAAVDLTFHSPSRAAIAVVSAINPAVSPNRNGWGFWIVTATGQPLQSVRRLRVA